LQGGKPDLEIAKQLLSLATNSKQGIPKTERVTGHSHIHGLGLDDSLDPKKNFQGIVGQAEAKKAAGIILNIIREGKMNGRAIFING
jgi:RuvB-like protein 2